MKIAWDAANEIGSKSINVQHQCFFDMINIFFAAYIKEEQFCAKLGYPAIGKQTKAHQQYQREISDLMRQRHNSRSATERLAEEVANSSVSWLTHHILRLGPAMRDLFHQLNR